jgi:LacI family transcriptional regulator
MVRFPISPPSRVGAPRPHRVSRTRFVQVTVLSSITISDVAQMAGVSIKTVSRVLNREAVGKATLARVLAAVDNLDYTPNASARALAGSRSYLIALYVDNPSADYVGRIERGAMAACRRSGYHLIVEALQDTGEGLREHITRLHASTRTDGVILTPPLCDNPQVLDALDAARARYVRIAPSETLERSPFLGMDDRRAAYEMTGYLLSLGHRDIAFIGGPPNHRAASQRAEGFRAAMAHASVSVRPEWVQAGEFSFRSGWDCGERLLEATNRPTAIFAGNDDMALGVMAVANRLHVDIPGELSLAGFDDSPSAQVVWPQLTTVRQPVFEMAAAAAEILIGAQRAPNQRPAGLMDFELVVRQSSARPPAAARRVG